MGIFRNAILAGVYCLAGCGGDNEKHILPASQVPYELRPDEMISGEPLMIHYQYPPKELTEGAVFVGTKRSTTYHYYPSKGKSNAIAVVLGHQGRPVGIGLATDTDLSLAEFDSCLHLLHNAKNDSLPIRLYGHICFEKDYLPFHTEHVGYASVNIEGIQVDSVYISLRDLPEQKQ